MEHPGRIWNSIETAFNRLAGRFLPAAALRWVWVLVHAAILCGAGCWLALATAGISFCVTGIILTHQSEPIYTATPDVINPAHEGKLVKISGVITSDSMVCDPLTGVQAKGPFLTRTTTLNPRQDYYELTYTEREQIREEMVKRTMPELRRGTEGPEQTRITIAGQGKLGAFRIPRFGEYLGFFHFTDSLKAKDLTFTQASPGLQARPLSPDSPHVVLSTEAGEDICYLQYYTGTTTGYIIARQFGNELDLTDQHAQFSTYESESWQNRRHAIRVLMEEQEMTVVLLLAILALFVLMHLALASLRAGVWHATAGRVNILRLPLPHISLLLSAGAILSGTAILQMMASRHYELSAQPGLAVLMAAAAVLCYTGLRWRSLADTTHRQTDNQSALSCGD